MPVSLTTLFRALIVALLSVHEFYVYGHARDAGTIAFAAGFALAMLLPFVWLVSVPDLPELYAIYVRGARRWRRGQCPGCGYDLSGRSSSDAAQRGVCPECGAALRPPPAYRVGGRTILRFAGFLLLAWVIGCTASELWNLHGHRLLGG